MDVTEIGNRIKKRRTALEMTQKDLAKKMNVSNQLISKWETGESIPSLEYLDALCKALKVDYSYFTSDSENGEQKPEDDQPTKPKRQSKVKWNWKLFIIIVASILAAAFIAGFTVLTIFVFVPSANRKHYLREIETAYEKYFELGYYSINVKTELDGDVKNDYRYDGYFDENGNPVFYDTESKIVVKEDILTSDNGEYKYQYTPDKTYETLEEMALDKINPDGKNGELVLVSRDAEDDIRYIRKIKSGYYLEIKDEFFTDELSGTQKKNYKLTDKIKGWVEVKNGLLSSMKVTVKYFNKPDNEHFTISVIFEFIAEKPVIEHKTLEEREWNGTYVGDTWYPSESPDSPDVPIDTTPKCEDLLSAEDFVSRLSEGKSRKTDNDYDFNKLVLEGQVKCCGYYYYFKDGKLTILNSDYLFESESIDLTRFGEIPDVYAAYSTFYWTEYKNYKYTIYRYSKYDDSAGHIYDFISTQEREVILNGHYALIWEEGFSMYIVIDLNYGDEVNIIRDAANPYMDSYGNVYCEQNIDGDFVPVVYKRSNGMQANTKYTVLKGNDFFRIDGKIFTGGDNVYTVEDDTVYRYINGELRYKHNVSDPIFKKNYKSLTSGYCIMGTDNIFDENGEKREFGTFKLEDENGEWQTVYDYGTKEIIAVMDGKLIVSIGYFDGYYAVYDETDLSKPLYCMKKPEKFSDYCEFDEMEILRIGSKTIIAVRTDTADYYGYELYYF